jgi:hypothetical protein
LSEGGGKRTGWLTRRGVFQGIRAHMLEAFDDVTGVIVNSSEFFDVKGSWPLAFTVWRYKSKREKLDPYRTVELLDLTWMRKTDLAQISWDEPQEMEESCNRILSHSLSTRVDFGKLRASIKEWSGETRKDFQRNKRVTEKNRITVGGLPLGDHRHANKKAYGESDGKFIGFMDDLTPCRVPESIPDKPWFRLDVPFMDVKKNRCLSGPPSQKGFCASNLESAKKLFFWFALAKTFLQYPYPMWVDANDLWEPVIPGNLEKTLFQMAFAIGYADNECVQTHYPANNPVRDVSELVVSNPMSPLQNTFWLNTMLPYCDESPELVRSLISAVDKLFSDWKKLFRGQIELPISKRAYMLDDRGVQIGAGVLQIRTYAEEAEDKRLLDDWSEVARLLIDTKAEFYRLLTSTSGVNYYGVKKKAASASAGKNGSRKALA